MKHENFRDMISFYIDDVLNETEKKEFENHLKQCSECKMEFDEMKLILSELSLMEELDLPENFESELKVKLIANNEIKKKSIFNRKYIYSTVAALILLISGAAYLNNYTNITDEASRNSLPKPKAMSEAGSIKDKAITTSGSIDTTMLDRTISGEFLFISEIKVKNDNGKYQSWADDIIKKAGGNLLSSNENSVSKVFEYEIAFDKFWTVLERITNIVDVKANTNASLSTITRAEEVSDSVVAFEATAKTKIIITLSK